MSLELCSLKTAEGRKVLKDVWHGKHARRADSEDLGLEFCHDLLLNVRHWQHVYMFRMFRIVDIIQFVFVLMVNWRVNVNVLFCVLAELAGVNYFSLVVVGWGMSSWTADWTLVGAVGYRSGIYWVNCEWEHLMWVTGQWWAHVRFLCVWVCDCVRAWAHLTSFCICVAVDQGCGAECCSLSFYCLQLKDEDEGMTYHIMRSRCPAVVEDYLPLVAKS